MGSSARLVALVASLLFSRFDALARLAGLGLEPVRQLLGKRIEPALAGPLGVGRLLVAAAQVLPDGVARQAGASGYLADGQLLARGPPPDETPCATSITPVLLPQIAAG